MLPLLVGKTSTRPATDCPFSGWVATITPLSGSTPPRKPIGSGDTNVWLPCRS